MVVATDERRVLRGASGRASRTHLELQIIPVVRKSSLTLAAVKSDAVPICRLAEVAQSGQETHVDGCADVTRQYDGASGRLCSPCIGTTAPYARGRVVRPLLQSSFFCMDLSIHGTEGVNPFPTLLYLRYSRIWRGIVHAPRGSRDQS